MPFLSLLLSEPSSAMRLAPPLMTSAILLTIALTVGGCFPTTGPGPEDLEPINPDIVALECCQTSSLWMGIWKKGMGDEEKDRVYTTRYVRVFNINDQFEATQDRALFEEVADGRPSNFITLNEAGDRLLVVRSLNPYASTGSLHEFNTKSNNTPEKDELPTLRDSSYAVSSAVYLPGSSASKVVYYSYGNADKELQPGYHLFDKDTGRDSLLLEHSSPVGLEEVVNGFDVSPDGSTLLYPLHYESRMPQAVAYSLESGVKDTLDIAFDHQQFLWFRYSPDGDQILYANYPVGIGGSTVPDTSQMGIFDPSSGQKQVLDVNTDPHGGSVQFAPTWGPNGRHIVYGSAGGPHEEPPGAKGGFQLYVLRNVN